MNISDLKKYITPLNILFLALLIVAAFLRLYKIEEFATFLGDQGRDAVIIKRIVTLEHLTAIGPPSSIGQVFLGPFYYYFIAPFLLFFNFNPAGLSIGMAVYSLIAFVFSYIVIKKEVNPITAILFAVLLTFSSVSIDMSRFSWNPNPLPFFAFFTLYFWYKTLLNKHWIYPVLFGAFFACSFQLHHLAILLGPTIALTFLVYFKKNSIAQNIKKVAISVAGFTALNSPLILFDLKNNFLNTKSFLGIFTNTEDSIIAKTSLIDRITDTITALFTHSFAVQFPELLAVLLFIVFTIVVLVLWKNKKINNLLIQMHLLNIILFTLSFGLLNSQRHAHYYGTVYYSVILAVAYLLYYLQKNKVMRFSVVPLLIAFFIYFNATHFYFLYKEPNNQIKEAETIADSIIPYITSKSFQLVPLPISVTDGHVRYFLEAKGYTPLDVASPVQGDELFVMCYGDDPCEIFGNPQWQIAAFENQKVDTMWKSKYVTIYKLVHEK